MWLNVLHQFQSPINRDNKQCEAVFIQARWFSASEVASGIAVLKKSPVLSVSQQQDFRLHQAKRVEGCCWSFSCCSRALTGPFPEALMWQPSGCSVRRAPRVYRFVFLFRSPSEQRADTRQRARSPMFTSPACLLQPGERNVLVGCTLFYDT